MKEKVSPRSRVLLGRVVLFEKISGLLQPPFVKLLVVLVAVVLLALLLSEGSTNPNLGFGLVALVALIFASLAAALQYAEMQLRYSKRTEERLKSTLREVVMDLQKEKTGQTPLNPVKLIEVLDTRFDSDGLRSLCLDLRTAHPDRMVHLPLDYDDLPGRVKAAKVRELILYCQRRDMLSELASAIRRQRPDIPVEV